MSAMTSSAAASRILLLADKPPAASAASGPKVRRYRLARVQLNEPRTASDRFGHLKRSTTDD